MIKKSPLVSQRAFLCYSIDVMKLVYAMLSC